MADPLLNPSTRANIDMYLRRPAHALLLAGRAGVGLKTIAHMIAAQLHVNSVVQLVEPDEKGTIAIDTIRSLYRLTRTHRDTPLVVIIDDAEAMGREAQNALLKLLEEPVDQVYFMLTSHAAQLLLPTIASRLQRIEVLPVASSSTESLLARAETPALKAQIAFLANGLPAEITRLLDDPEYLSRQQKTMKDARAFLEGDTYGRLIFVKEYSGDRAAASDFLGSLSKLTSFMMLTRGQPELAPLLEAVEEVIERLQQNAHTRTQLMYLVTRLG